MTDNNDGFVAVNAFDYTSLDASTLTNLLPSASPYSKMGNGCGYDFKGILGDEMQAIEFFANHPILYSAVIFYPSLLTHRLPEFKFRSHQLDNEDDLSSYDLEDWLMGINAQHYIKKALVSANTFGSSLLVPIYSSDMTNRELELPLDFSQLSNSELISFRVLNCHEASIIVDRNNQLSGYQIGTAKFHKSRVFRFDYMDCLSDNYWSHSMVWALQKAYEAYIQADEISNKILASISVPKFKMKDLQRKLQKKNTRQLIKQRLSMVKESIDRMGAIALDMTEEEFEYEQRDPKGVQQLVLNAKQHLSAASQIPESILLSTGSTGGSLANADSTEQNFIQAMVNQKIGMLDNVYYHLAKFWAVSNGISPRGLKIHYKPVNLPTEKETASTNKLNCEAEAIKTTTAMNKQLHDLEMEMRLNGESKSEGQVTGKISRSRNNTINPESLVRQSKLPNNSRVGGIRTTQSSED